MKKLLSILAVYLMVGVIGCQKEDFNLTVENNNPASKIKTVAIIKESHETRTEMIKNRLEPLSKESETITVLFDNDMEDAVLKSANVVQTNYFQRIDVHSGEYSFLQIFCRNKNKVDGRSGNHLMNQFLIELPDFIADEDITEIKYARKNAEEGEPYTIRDDDEDWKAINEKIKSEVRLDKYTVNNVLKIEQGLQNDDWLIIKIRLNKSVNYTLNNAPYYVKIASEWYLKHTVGFGEKNYTYGQW